MFAAGHLCLPKKVESVTRYTPSVHRPPSSLHFRLDDITSARFFLRKIIKNVFGRIPTVRPSPFSIFFPSSFINPSSSTPVSRNNGVPPAPPQLSVLGTTSSSITLSWNASSSSSGPAAGNYAGGSPLLAYHLHYHREFGDWERVEVSVVVVVLVFGDFINSDTQSQLCSHLKSVLLISKDLEEFCDLAIHTHITLVRKIQGAAAARPRRSGHRLHVQGAQVRHQVPVLHSG